MRRVLVPSAATAVAVAATFATATPAQTPAPGLSVDLAPKRVTVAGGGAGVAAGPTRIVLRNVSTRGPAEASVAALKPGVTLADVRRGLRRATRGPTPLKRLLTFAGGGFVAPRGTLAMTVDLKPGTTYLVANIGRDAARSPITTFTVTDQANGATAPAPDATVGVYDYAFGMPSSLPRQGTVRFENRGERLHIAVAFPVRSGANRAAAVKAFIANQERRAGRLTIGRQTFEPLGVISGGQSTDVEVEFPRAGNWVFVCFIADGEPGDPDHNELGMVKAFRVR